VWIVWFYRKARDGAAIVPVKGMAPLADERLAKLQRRSETLD
jgi:hypothetical protein